MQKFSWDTNDLMTDINEVTSPWMDRERNIGIGLPLIDTRICSQFFLSFLEMEKPATYHLFVPVFPHGEFIQDIAKARNNIVEQAYRHSCSDLIFMDTDQVYPKDTITKLLSHPKDIVGAVVHRRYPPFEPILMRGGIGQYFHIPDTECYSGDLVEVDATGCGCLKINMDVFQNFQREPFKISESAGKVVGEDIYFCAEALKHGYKIFVDTSIQVGHLSNYLINRSTYELFKHIKQFQYRQPVNKETH